MRRISVKLILLVATAAASVGWGQPPTITSLQASKVGQPAADVTGITSGTTLADSGFYLYANSASGDFIPTVQELQTGVFKASLLGPVIKENLSLLLIDTQSGSGTKKPGQH